MCCSLKAIAVRSFSCYKKNRSQDDCSITTGRGVEISGNVFPVPFISNEVLEKGGTGNNRARC